MTGSDEHLETGIQDRVGNDLDATTTQAPTNATPVTAEVHDEDADESRDESTPELSTATVSIDEMRSQEPGSRRPLHPILEPLYELKEQGEVLRSRMGLDRVADQIEQSKDTGPETESVWLDSVRLSFDASIDANDLQEGVTGLRKRFERFKLPVWSEIGQQTSRYYREMIELSVATGLDEKAIDLYEEGRDHVELTPDLRLRLLQVGTRLGRTDAATARLCIAELRDGERQSDKQVEELFDIIRNAIRIDLTFPPQDELDEYVELNQQIGEVADLAWVTGHLAMAHARQGRWDEVLALCRESRRLRQADKLTSLHVGASFYLARQWDESQHWLERAAEDVTFDEAALARFLRDLGRVNRLLIQGSDIADPPLQQQLKTALNELEVRDRSDAWQMDADWVIGGAMAAAGRTAEALARFEQAPVSQARWAFARSACEVSRLHHSAESVDWCARFEEQEQPALGRLLRVRLAIDGCRLQEARESLEQAYHVHGDALQNDAQLAQAATLLNEELQLHAAGCAPDSSLEDQLEEKEWTAQLDIQRHFERNQFDDVSRRFRSTDWLTTSEDRRRRIAAAFEAVTSPQSEHTDNRIRVLTEGPAALPVDFLHLGLWLCRRNQFEEALSVLNALDDSCAVTVEARLAIAECLLRIQSPIDQPQASDAEASGTDIEEDAETDRETIDARADDFAGRLASPSPQAIELLTEMATRATWQNSDRIAWFRPWQERVPEFEIVTAAKVAPPRIGDMLHAATLMLSAGLLDPAEQTVRHTEDLLGQDDTPLREQTGRLFARAARFEAEDLHWENACRLHQEASARDQGDPDFAETVAGAVREEEPAPEFVLQVLFDRVREFSGSEDKFLATPVNTVFHRLTRIDLSIPPTESEIDARLNWVQQFREQFPEWDLPKRSRACAHIRRREPLKAIKLFESLHHKTRDDNRLLGHARWEMQQFARAAEDFDAAGEPEWAACAQAAACLVDVLRTEQDVSQADADRLEKLLKPDKSDGELADRIRLWRGAVLTSAGRADQALGDLEQLTTITSEEAADVRILRGLCLIRLQRVDEALELWQPADPDSDRADPRAPDQMRREVSLWAIARLQDPRQHGLNRTSDIMAEFLKLGEQRDEFQIARAQLALRTGEFAIVREICARLQAPDSEETGNEELSSESLLLAPLRVLLRAEREFVEARMAAVNGQPEAVELLRRNAGSRVWPDRNSYWIALAELHSGQADQARQELQRLAESGHPAAAAQLALLTVDDDRDAAARFRAIALEHDPEQPFALLVSARLFEQTGSLEDAARYCRQIVDRGWVETGRRLQGVARLTLGRLACQEQRTRDALDEFREAVRVLDDSPVANRRLALLLTSVAQDEDELLEAGVLLDELHPKMKDDPQILLARACVASEVESDEVFADRLAELMGCRRFLELSQSIRRTLSVFSADTHLRLRRYGDAATALQTLLDEEHDPQIEERLRRCHLLDAVRVLGQERLPDDALDRVQKAADAVCDSPDPPLMARLLRIIVRVLHSPCPAEERTELLNEASSFTTDDAGLQEVLWMTRRLLGGTAAGQESEGEPSKEFDEDTQRWLDLLSANAEANGVLFLAEAQRLVDNGAFDDLNPFDAEEIIFAGALHAGQKKPDEGCRLLSALHEYDGGSPRTRRLNSHLTARRAVRALKGKRFGETQQLLEEALTAASGITED